MSADPRDLDQGPIDCPPEKTIQRWRDQTHPARHGWRGLTVIRRIVVSSPGGGSGAGEQEG